MLRIRFVCVAAATLSIASVTAAVGANAQSATPDPGTTPSLLTQLFGQATAAPAPASTAAAPAISAAPPVKSTRSRRVTSTKHRADTKQAANQHGDSSVETPQSNASADAWLAASAPPPNAVPANSIPASPPAPADTPRMAAADPAQQDNAPAASAALPSSVVVGGQTVQIAKADQVNELDLAASSAPAPSNAPAGNTPSSNTFAAAPSGINSSASNGANNGASLGPTMQATMETVVPRADRADMIGAAAVKAARVDATFAALAPAAPSNGGETIADSRLPDAAAQDSGAQSINDQNANVQDSGTLDSGTQDSGMLGGMAWIAEVLAALGGAVTAGVFAWFLIGGEPVRNYG
jgi:hypothetical protein